MQCATYLLCYYLKSFQEYYYFISLHWLSNFIYMNDIFMGLNLDHPLEADTSITRDFFIL